MKKSRDKKGGGEKGERTNKINVKYWYGTRTGIENTEARERSEDE